jgi:hypothetical protein
VQARRAAGYTNLYSRRGLAPLLGFLASRGAGPVEVPAPPTREQVLLASYQKYLLYRTGVYRIDGLGVCDDVAEPVKWSEAPRVWCAPGYV